MSWTRWHSFALIAIVALVAALFGGAPLQAQAALRWVKAAPFPEPEEELYAVTVNGKMYVIGGFGYMPFGNPPGLVYEYDPGPDKWTKKKILPQRVHHQAQSVSNNKIYVFGGCKMGIFGTDAVTNVWEYDPATDNYRAMAPILGPRCSAVAATMNNKIYLIGGIEPFENGQGSRISGRNQVFDPVANTWGAADLSPMPTTRNHAFVGVVNNKISPRSGGGWATYNGKIYVAGGEVQNERYSAAFRSLESYDPVANRWDILPSLPGAVHGNAVAFIGNKLHTVSGKMEGGGFADAPGKATADHSVMEMHAAGTQ